MVHPRSTLQLLHFMPFASLPPSRSAGPAVSAFPHVYPHPLSPASLTSCTAFTNGDVTCWLDFHQLHSSSSSSRLRFTGDCMWSVSLWFSASLRFEKKCTVGSMPPPLITFPTAAASQSTFGNLVVSFDQSSLPQRHLHFLFFLVVVRLVVPARRKLST